MATVSHKTDRSRAPSRGRALTNSREVHRHSTTRTPPRSNRRSSAGSRKSSVGSSNSEGVVHRDKPPSSRHEKTDSQHQSRFRELNSLCTIPFHIRVVQGGVLMGSACFTVFFSFSFSFLSSALS